MRILRRLLGFALGVFLVISIASPFLPSVPVRAQGEQQTVRLAWLNDTETLNPLTYELDWDDRIVACLYDRLWELNPDTLMPIPWIAYEWTQLDSWGEYWRIKIHNNVSFQDGTPLTTEHIAFTYWFMRYFNRSSWHLDNAVIQGVLENITIEDAYTFTINLTYAYAPFPAIMNPRILPEHEWKDYVTNWGGSVAATSHPWVIDNSSVWDEDFLGTKAPIGCGPFKFASRIPGDYIELEKNDDYWVAGLPKADKLVMKIISDASDQIEAVKDGEVELMGTWVPLDEIAALEGHPTVGLFETDDRSYSHLSFNFRMWPMNVSSFRKAVRAAIDTQRIVDEIILGYGIPGTVNLPTALRYWFYNASLDDYPWLDSDKNLTLARNILFADGWTDNDTNGKLDTWTNGIQTFDLRVDKPTIEVLGLSSDPVIVSMCNMICSDLEELFDADFVPLLTDLDTVIVRVLYTNVFDLFVWDYTVAIEPGEVWRMAFHSSSAGFLGAINCFPILNATLDAAINYFLNTTSEFTQAGKTRQEWGYEVQKILAEQGPQWALYYGQYVQAYRIDQVDGLVEMPSGIVSRWLGVSQLRLPGMTAPPGGALNTWTFRNIHRIDITPPADIIDLTAGNPTVNSITLSWTAPGDDGNTGNASGYIVKYSVSGPLNDSNWNSATTYAQSWTPLSAGNTEIRKISNLLPDTQYWFAIKAYDGVPNYSNISNSPSETTIAGSSGSGTSFNLDATETFNITLHVESTQPVEVTITHADTPGTVPSQFSILGSAFSITANLSSGFTITITYHYEDEQVAALGIDESTLAINHWDDISSSWVELSTTVDSVDNLLTTTVTGLTVFAVFGQPPGADNTLLIIIIGGIVGAVAVISVAISFIRRRP